MKRYPFLFGMIVSFVCLLASCSKSPEQKVKDLVGAEIKKHLYSSVKSSFFVYMFRLASLLQEPQIEGLI